MNQKGGILIWLGIFAVVAFASWWWWGPPRVERLRFKKTTDVSDEKPAATNVVKTVESAKQSPAESGIANELQSEPSENTNSTTKKPLPKTYPEDNVTIAKPYESRDFSFPEKYPGANLQILEEKKIEFMINDLKMFRKDAEEVSEAYKEMLEESNEAMRARPEQAMEEVSRIAGEYDHWLLERLGEEDFHRYGEFVTKTMEQVQGGYKQFRESQARGKNANAHKN